MRHPGLARGQQHAEPYPFRVDLMPPSEGFSDTVEREILRFLERRIGGFDVWSRIATGGEFLRYCFAHRTDADAFHRQFAPVVEKAVLREFFPRPEKI